jgi:hypothetical protein
VEWERMKKSSPRRENMQNIQKRYQKMKKMKKIDTFPNLSALFSTTNIT